jgi:hypothetical protein
VLWWSWMMGRKQSCHKCICLRKARKRLSQDSWFPVWDMTSGTSKICVRHVLALNHPKKESHKRQDMYTVRYQVLGRMYCCVSVLLGELTLEIVAFLHVPGWSFVLTEICKFFSHMCPHILQSEWHVWAYICYLQALKYSLMIIWGGWEMNLSR